VVETAVVTQPVAEVEFLRRGQARVAVLLSSFIPPLSFLPFIPLHILYLFLFPFYSLTHTVILLPYSPTFTTLPGAKRPQSLKKVLGALWAPTAGFWT